MFYASQHTASHYQQQVVKLSFFKKTISIITQISSAMFQADLCFCYFFRDNILQNCQYEEVFKGYANFREKEKCSVCQTIN